MLFFTKNKFFSLRIAKWILYFAAGILLSPWIFAKDLKPVSLPDAIEYARTHHPRIKAADLEVKIRKEGVTEARSPLFPEITANVLETTGFPSSTGGLGVRGLANSPYKRGWGVDVEVEQTLFDFGRTIALIRAARADENYARAARTGAEWEVMVDLQRTYAFAQMMKDRVALYESAVGDVKTVLQEVERFVKTGQRSPVESSLLRVQLADLQQSLVMTRKLDEASISELNVNMGVDGENRFTIKAGEPQAVHLENLRLQPVSELVATAMENNPKVQQMKTQEAKLEAEVDRATSEYLPKIIGVVNAGTFYDTRFVKRDDYAAGAVFKMPLFDGLKTHSRHEQARLRLDKAQQEKIQIQNALALQIQKIILDFQVFLEVSPLIETQMEEARRALKLSKERYLAKSGLISELDQAQKAFIKARENDLQTRFKTFLDDILLKQAIGDVK